MAETNNELPKAFAHGELEQVFDDVFFVTGGIRVGSGPPMQFSRSMTVIRQESGLTLVNSMRLSKAGLAALERLGKVEHVIRIAGFHGRDDQFYQRHYGAKVWALEGQEYFRGFKPGVAEPYFEPDVRIAKDTELPLHSAQLYWFKSCVPPEALLVLERNNGIAVTGDALQNWGRGDPYFSFLGKWMMKMMGFLKPCNVGPGWLKITQPKPSELLGILELEFEHVLPAHGAPVIGGAKDKFRAAIERASSKPRA